MKSLSAILILCVLTISAKVVAQTSPIPISLMCEPGELIFAEDFEPETISLRWGFKADFALRDGALLRTNVNPTESRRVFLKDASFKNTIIQFDFKLSGKTTDLRLVTGSGGGYNSVTQIHREHFQINTPVDRNAGFVPAHLGECVRQPHPGQWQTMTVEYWDDEMIAHLSRDEFVIGRHPIIDRTRKYFAFQFDLPGASIDNVRIWKAVSQRADWRDACKKLTAIQSQREPVKRDPVETYKVAYTNLKSHLTLHDPAYRKLVARHEKLKVELQADYAEAFVTHKRLTKQIAKTKQQLKASNPEFKLMEVAVNKARKAEDDYVLSTQPKLALLKEDRASRQRFASELGQVRLQLEAKGDPQLAELVAKTAERQAELERRFPGAFRSVEQAVEERKAKRKVLNDDSGFQIRNKAVVDASKAIKEYELNADPNLAQLAAKAKVYTDSLKSSGSK